MLLLLIPLLEAFFRYAVAERMGAIVLSALVAHTGWHWMADRAGRLRQFPFEWPVLSAAFLAVALRWLMAMVFLAGVVWLVSTLSATGYITSKFRELSIRARDGSRPEPEPRP